MAKSLEEKREDAIYQSGKIAAENGLKRPNFDDTPTGRSDQYIYSKGFNSEIRNEDEDE